VDYLRVAASFLLATFAMAVAAHGTGHNDRAAGQVPATKPIPAAPAIRPSAPIVSLDAPGLGKRDADIVIVEYADYQCPFCRRFHLEQLPKLQKRFVDTGVAQYVFKDFPLQQHREAMSAAVFAHCAGEQGKYWLMQQHLFREQSRLGETLYAELAKRLALSTEKMRACRADRSMRMPIEQATAEAMRLGIRTTPTILLARRQGDTAVVLRAATGMPNYDDLVREIESLQENAGRPLAEQAAGQGIK